MKSVAIIGGGITGLTAAFELHKAGVPFTLYEGSERVGGPIRTVRAGKYLAECGPNTILETSPLISELIKDLGLEARRIYSDPQAANRYIACGGRPVPLPTSVVKFIRTPLFSARAKLRLGMEPFIRRSSEEIEESVGSFVVRRLGAEFLDYAINPLVGGVYAGDPALLSVKHAFPKLHGLEQRYGSLIAGQVLGARERKRRGGVSKQNAPKFSFDEGLEVLVRTLHERMRDSISVGHKISQLRRTEHGWQIIGRSHAEETRDDHCAVLIAIAAHDLAKIRIDGVDPAALRELGEIYYPPVASVALGFRREDVAHPLDGFGVLVPEAEGMNILGTIFSSSLFPGRAASGEVLLTSYSGGSRAPELAMAHSELLVANTLRDLRSLLGVRGAPTFQHSFVFKAAIPQYNVGYGRFKDLMAEVEERAPGLLIGGHCRSGISLGDSIVSGREMAGQVQKYLSTITNQVRPNNEYASAA